MVACNMRICNMVEYYKHHCHDLVWCRLGVPVCFACFAFRNVTMADQLYGIPASRAAIAPATGTTREIIAGQTLTLACYHQS